MKARAWLDLTAREQRGESIDSKVIRKHKNDVFRLYQVLDPERDPEAPAAVRADISEFIQRVRAEGVELKAFGIQKATLDDVLAGIASVYRIEAN